VSSDLPTPAVHLTSRERRKREAVEHNAARAGRPNLVTSEILAGFAADINTRVHPTNMVTWWHEMAERINAHVLRGAA
jgi:hypothetical protein